MNGLCNKYFPVDIAFYNCSFIILRQVRISSVVNNLIGIKQRKKKRQIWQIWSSFTTITGS